jgi:signal transduction histidine kinase
VTQSLLETDSTRLECQEEALSPAAQEEFFLQEDYRTVLATLAHDLKNPLTRIRGRSQLLQRSVRESESLDRRQLEEGLAQIEAATRRMAFLLDELVHLSATGSGLRMARQPVDLVVLARYLAEQYEQASDRHRIRVETRQREIVGQFDRTRLERVISNLLSNAVKYSPDGGDVVISVREEPDWAGHPTWLCAYAIGESAFEPKTCPMSLTTCTAPATLWGVSRGQGLASHLFATWLPSMVARSTWRASREEAALPLFGCRSI